MIVILSRPLTEAIESHNTWIRNRGSLQVIDTTSVQPDSDLHTDKPAARWV
jgi:hypothetical protein